MMGARRLNHRQGIDEQTDHFLRTGQIAGPARHGHAEGNRPAAAITLQQQTPGGLRQGIDRQFGTLCGLAQGRKIVALYLQGMQRIALPRGAARQRVGQTRRRFQDEQALPPIAFDRDRIAFGQPGDVVAEFRCRWRRGIAAIASQHFAEQAGAAPAIQQQMVAEPDEMENGVLQAHQHQFEQRRAVGRQTLRLQLLQQARQGRMGVAAAAPIKFDQRQRQMLVYDLHGLRPVRRRIKRRAQYRVALHRHPPRRGETAGIEAFQAHVEAADITGGIVFVPAVKQHALLHRRQRINAGNLRHRQRQGIQLRLRQTDQRKIARRGALRSLPTMLDQRGQFEIEVLRQRGDGFGAVTAAVVAPVHRQTAVIDLAVDFQRIIQRRTGVAFVAARFAGRAEQAVGGETGIELP